MTKSTDVHLDWLRYTVAWREQVDELENLNHARPGNDLFNITGEAVDIGQGYNQGVRLNAGIMLWNTDRHSQGISVQMSGSDLQALRHSAIGEADMLRFIAAVGGHVSTMHACINLHGCGADVRALISEHEAGKMATRAHQVGVYSSKSKVGDTWLTGDTFYVGSPKSKVQIRVYNKAAEQGITGDWTRIEIVWRGKIAQAAHALMIQTSIEAVTRGAIQHMMSTELPWWVDAMTGEMATPHDTKHKQSKRYAWLMQSVLPALRSELDEADKISAATLRNAFKEVVDAPPSRRG